MHKTTLLKVFMIALMYYQIQSLDADMVLVKNLTGNSQGGIFKIPPITKPMNLSMTSLIQFEIAIWLYNTSEILLHSGIAPLGSYKYLIAPSNQTLYLYINKHIPKFSIVVVLGTTILSSIDPLAYAVFSPIYQNLYRYFSVKNDCIMQVDKSSFSPNFINALVLLSSLFDHQNLTLPSNVHVYKYTIYLISFGVIGHIANLETPYYFPLYTKKGFECEIEEVYFCQYGLTSPL